MFQENPGWVEPHKNHKGTLDLKAILSELSLISHSPDKIQKGFQILHARGNTDGNPGRSPHLVQELNHVIKISAVAAGEIT